MANYAFLLYQPYMYLDVYCTLTFRALLGLVSFNSISCLLVVESPLCILPVIPHKLFRLSRFNRQETVKHGIQHPRPTGCTHAPKTYNAKPPPRMSRFRPRCHLPLHYYPK